MRKWCPLTKEIAFARLDKMLSDEEKEEIVKRIIGGRSSH